MRRIKICTHIDRKPNYLFDLWVKHHLRFFGKDDFLFVCDNRVDTKNIQKYLSEIFNIHTEIKTDINNQSDIITSILLVNKNDSPVEYRDFVNQIITYHNSVQYKLFDNGVDVVIWLDIDELIYHDDLVSLLQTSKQKAIRALGIEVVQDLKNERDFDFGKKIREQRSKIMYNEFENKPIVLFDKLKWIPGKHDLGDVDKNPKKVYDGLYIFHLHYFDLESIKSIYEQNLKLYNKSEKERNQSGVDFIINKFDELQKHLVDGTSFISKLEI